MKLKFGVLCGLLLAGANAMACYTVYDGNNRVLYRGLEAPVDMSLPLHQALAGHFPAGSSLVFDQSPTCARVNIAQVARPIGPMVPVNTIRNERTGRQLSPSSEAPMLTDRATAMSQGLPHTVVAGDVVMVPGSAASRMNMRTYSVIPSATAGARAPAPPRRTTIARIRADRSRAGWSSAECDWPDSSWRSQ